MIRGSRANGQRMSGTTPSEPPVGGTPVPPSRDPFAPASAPDRFAPPDGDLMFPAPTDGTWQQGTTARSGRRWVLVVAAIAVLVVVAGVVAIGLRVLSNATSSATDVLTPGTSASVGDLAVGACYRLQNDDRTADSVGAVDVVACTTPHDGQVYAKVPLDYADYPGDAELSTAADAGCAAQDAVALDQAVRAIDTISPAWYGPLEADWADTRHVAACVIESDEIDGLTRSWTAGTKA
jgi:hypothetical protein